MAGNLELVKKLREESGAGFLACQKALQEANTSMISATQARSALSRKCTLSAALSSPLQTTQAA